jgi:hypothetical protein
MKIPAKSWPNFQSAIAASIKAQIIFFADMRLHGKIEKIGVSRNL